MNSYIGYENEYVTFEIKNNIFAVPINHSVGFIDCRNDNISYTTIPQAPKNIKYLLHWWNEYITVVQMPDIHEDIPITESIIVLLQHTNQIIGIMSKSVDHVSIPTDKILEDSNTGQKLFVQAGKIYLILDINQLYEELGI